MKRVLNGLAGGFLGCAIASFGYLIWYTTDGGEIGSKGVRDMVALMSVVGACSTVGSVVASTFTRSPKAELPSRESQVMAWLGESKTIMTLEPATIAEVKEVLGDV